MKGRCIETANGWKCNCLEGWAGTDCDKPFCETYKKCKNGKLHFVKTGKCQEIEDGLFCNCTGGWAGKYCDKQTCSTYEKCKNGFIYFN